MAPVAPTLPGDATGRVSAHDELHARPVAPVTIPALVTQLTVLTQGHTAAEETAYLRGLATAHGLEIGATDVGLTLSLDPVASLSWERHPDYSLYTVRQPLDPAAVAAEDPDLIALVPLPSGWLSGVPGRTLSAVHIVLLPSQDRSETDAAAEAQRVLGDGRMLGSRVKDGTARLYTTYRLRRDGTSRFLVFCEDVTPGRAGRITASLLDAERYRMLALLGFPTARGLVPRLDEMEGQLAEFTGAVRDQRRDDRTLLDELIALAARVETEIAAHAGPFGAAAAYFTITEQRIEDLRGTSLPGMMGVFTFLRRRLLPAMATVETAGRRMDELSERVARTADLLRTRVEVATEAQNQDLLRELRRGQATQLRLQATVEELSIAAISYYVVSLWADVVRGLDAAGMTIDVALATAGSIPVVVVGVWWTLRRVKGRLHGEGSESG